MRNFSNDLESNLMRNNNYDDEQQHREFHSLSFHGSHRRKIIIEFVLPSSSSFVKCLRFFARLYSTQAANPATTSLRANVCIFVFQLICFQVGNALFLKAKRGVSNAIKYFTSVNQQFFYFSFCSPKCGMGH